MRSATERVLVLYEHSRAGAAVIDVGRELAEQTNAALTVVAVAPQAPSGPRCGNSAVEFNEVVVDSVARDLEKARRDLGPTAERANFVLLIEDAEPSLAQFAREGAFDVILLPAHRRLLRSGRYHPQAARLRLTAGAEIRIVDPAWRQQSPRPVGAAG